MSGMPTLDRGRRGHVDGGTEILKPIGPTAAKSPDGWIRYSSQTGAETQILATCTSMIARGTSNNECYEYRR